LELLEDLVLVQVAVLVRGLEDPDLAGLEVGGGALDGEAELLRQREELLRLRLHRLRKFVQPQATTPGTRSVRTLGTTGATSDAPTGSARCRDVSGPVGAARIRVRRGRRSRRSLALRGGRGAARDRRRPARRRGSRGVRARLRELLRRDRRPVGPDRLQVDLPARELGGEAGVLAAAADGPRGVVL